MRKLLLPISLLYNLVLFVRHKLFDWHILKSTRFDLPVICVGNLSLGGTGKTPHTEYITQLLSSEYRLAILSRGYGRSSKGFRLADNVCTAADIGDEPMQYFTKFNNIQIAVDEDRVDGVQKLLGTPTPPQVVILDDAFQHRKIEAGLNILLTDYQHLFCEDYLIPTGRLRDIKQAARRSEIIVVSKSPKNISEGEKKQIISKLNVNEKQKVYFSYLEYGALLPLNEKAKETKANQADKALLFTGIAQPEPLVRHLSSCFNKVENIAFGDHHSYTENDLKKVVSRFETMEGKDKIIVTTEKDAARLSKSAYLCPLESLPLFAAPIYVRFHEEEKFNEDIKDYVRQNSTNGYVSAPND